MVSRDLPSSTVITPSLPTLSIAWAMIFPISVSWLAAQVPTCSTCSEELIFLESLASWATRAATALSMPRLIWLALAPAVMFLRPSLKMASA